MASSAPVPKKAQKSRAASKRLQSLSVKPDEPEVISPSPESSSAETSVLETGNSELGVKADALESRALCKVQETAAERGRRDLFFLCKEILHYRDMIPRVHQPVCDLYGTPKWCDGDNWREVFYSQDTIHNYLLIDPRGEFKTSISLGKMLQNWVNFPDVAMLRMAGKESLVKDMVQEVRDQILTNTDFRETYSKHVPWSTRKGEEGQAPGDFGTAFKMTNPARRTPRKDATIAISTLDSVKASTHCEWLSGDDLVHEKNYQTKDLLETTKTDWDHAHNLVNPEAFRELVGTRYDWSDLYGDIIERLGGLWRIHVRPIWTPDRKFAEQHGFYLAQTFRHPKTGEDLYLLHPERWRLEKLLELQDENPYLFNCQRLNNPIPASADNFPMPELVRHTVTRDKYPDTGLLNIFMGWKFDFTDAEAEPAVGVVGGWDSKGRLFVIDLVMGRFKPSQIIDLMIIFWQKWPISRMVLADNKKERMLEPGLMSRLRMMKLSFPIDWVKFGGNDQTEDAMISYVLALEPLLRENQLWFHGELPHLTNLYLQFSRFPKFKLRGIPYAISRLMHYKGQSRTLGDAAVYGSELYSPALSWDREDMELGAGLTG
jgi:hypothetical protein